MQLGEVRDFQHQSLLELQNLKFRTICQLSANWITERIDDDRFSENNVDSEIDKIEKALNGNIDFEKINALIPKLYFVDRRNKFKITKKDLLEWVS